MYFLIYTIDFLVCNMREGGRYQVIRKQMQLTIGNINKKKRKMFGEYIYFSYLCRRIKKLTEY